MKVGENFMDLRGRYAPSPTGNLHLGNLRTALLAWLECRRANGHFVLRIEDLDLPRARPGIVEQMIDDLHWLGLDWDEGPDIGGFYGPYRQSDRQSLYFAALASLREQDLLYPCYCSRAELAHIASAPHSGEELRYPGTCRMLSAYERQLRESAGRKPALRLRVPEGSIAFDDGVAGLLVQDVQASIGDFIVQRSDGIVAYQLAVVVDDALMDITQVVRGVDLLDSTARQILLFHLLGWREPRYEHVPLLKDATGAKLSKRDRTMGLGPSRAAGQAPEQVVGQLAASAGIWPENMPVSAQDLLDKGYTL
jgi:glutamyl-tRNA synthetase